MPTLNPPYAYSLGYIILPVELKIAPSSLTVGGNTYQVKDEFHASIMAVKLIVPEIMARDHLGQTESESLVTEAAFPIVNELKPFVATIGPELRFVEQPERGRRTIIAMATVESLEAVFTRLNQALGLNVSTQPGYITIATWGPNMPIGVPNQEFLNSHSRPLTDTEIDQLRPQLDIETLFGVTS